MKKCFKCQTEKPLTEFYKHREMADGYLNKCKSCTKADSLTRRHENIDAVRADDKQRHKGRNTAAYIKSWRARYPNKYKAQTAISNAIRAGLMIKKPCESCGAIKAHAHHDDYSMPLAVRWLCAIHHKEWHQRHGEGRNA